MRQIIIAIFIAIFFTSAYAKEDISWQLEEYLEGYSNAYFNAEYQKAIDLGLSALNIIEKIFTSEHPNAAAMLNNLATLYKAQGKYAESAGLYKKAIIIYEKSLGPNNLYNAKVWSALGENYQARCKYTEAENAYKNAQSIFEKSLGNNDVNIAIVRSHLGSLYKDQRKYAEAENILKASLQTIGSASGGGHPVVIRLAADIGKLYETQGKITEAEPYYRYAWDVFKGNFYQDDASIEQALNRLKSEAARLWGQQNEPIYKRLMNINDLYIGPWHPDAPMILDELPTLYLKQTRDIEAVNIYEGSLGIMLSNLGPEHLNIAKVLENMAKFYRKIKDFDRAKELSKKAELIRSHRTY